MRQVIRISLSAAALALAAGAGAAAAQEAPGFVACSTQSGIEQYLGTGGDIMPDDCRVVGVAVLESEGRQLCALDIGGAQEGIVGAIQDATIPSQWWAACEAVAGELP